MSYSVIVTPPTSYILTFIKPFSFVWYVIPLLKTGFLVSTHDLFLRFWQWKHKKKRRSHVRTMLSGIILAWWQHPVVSSEALELLHWAMCAVMYRRIAMAIKMAIFARVFVDCCLYACCPGGRWGNTEWVVTQCRRPVASRVALDMPHRAMPCSLLQRICMAIKMACNGGTFVRHCQFCHRQ
jgi:hypothetical protein